MTEPGQLGDDRTICERLEQLGISFQRFDHPPVFTCEAAEALVPREAVGVQTKNLFLRDKKGRRHWLLVTSCAKAVDLKALGPVIGADHLSLGSPDRLARYLGVTPGAVTVLALAHDAAHEVDLVVDAEVWDMDAWRCHPLVNTATLVLSRPAIERFLAATAHVPRLVTVPERPVP